MKYYNYLFALLALVIGVAAGFRSIHEDDRFRSNAKSAAGTLWGWLYLISRGAVSAAAFCVLYYLGKIGDEPLALLMWSGFCGLSAEIVLRSTIYLYLKKVEGKSGGLDKPVNFSPLDFLRWWQGYCLQQASGPVAKEAQRTIRKLMQTMQTPISFDALIRLINKNKGALQSYGSMKINRLEKEIQRLTREYKYKTKGNGGKTDSFDEIYCHGLAYSILEILDRDAIEILFEV